MAASAARIAANRANSLKSTGPRTPEGKARSRANSLQHGLCSTVVVHPDDARALQAGAAAGAVAPGGRGLGDWMMDQVTLATWKVERCQSMELAARARVIARASATWDDDRRGEAIRLGSKLAGRPEEVVARLRETWHGCEWLTTRWALLAHAADSQGAWPPEQEALAFDLLGTPAEFREGYPPGTEIDLDGRLVEPIPGPGAVARLALGELQARCEALAPLDRADRERAESDLSDDDPEVRRLRRYEAELHRRIKWALGQVQGPTTTGGDEATPAGSPGMEADPEPEHAPTPSLPPPGPGPTAPPSRAERRLIKADSRREAKRRKLDHLRA